MTPSITQNLLHPGLEALQHIQGHKGLDGPGKSAAVNPAGPPAIQQTLRCRQSHGHLLMLLVPGGNHVLQIPPAGEAGQADLSQEGGEIIPAKGGNLLLYPAVFIIDMDGPQDRPVARRF